MGKYGNSGADAAPRRAETPGSIPLDCTGLSRFPEVNFRKNSFHSGEISHTLRPRFQHAASAVGRSTEGEDGRNPPRTNAHRKPRRMNCAVDTRTDPLCTNMDKRPQCMGRTAGTCEPAAHKWTQKAPGAEPGAFHVISF